MLAQGAPRPKLPRKPFARHVARRRKYSATRTRARVARVRAECPSQLDDSGSCTKIAAGAPFAAAWRASASGIARRALRRRACARPATTARATFGMGPARWGSRSRDLLLRLGGRHWHGRLRYLPSRMMTRAGLKPAIAGVESQCLIHSATGRSRARSSLAAFCMLCEWLALARSKLAIHLALH